ncbi:hypothetical protein [Methanosphaera cuniculi]|uniref:DUF5655 domain-containing protein n=1 Tax=Methanosphaera cuniculi TaxID=1077256 RepID=A0A2A2HDW1_9EURY|nr:hypothetical protein [Methanosphaera cuniculi]PAV07444.1 hypothetical protein ASJ82_02400 [Methanosphaera cuniculi]PWL08431.1 hypothetical protein MSCUN_06810 [Methanosphaera cuniculi]
MTYGDKSIVEIIGDDEYPLCEMFNKLISRIDSKTSNVVKQINDDEIIYSNRNMEFAKIIPEEDHVKVIVEVPYDRIIDLSGRCSVEKFAGYNETDLVSFNITNQMDMQYAVSMYDQAYTYVKRLKL